MIPHQTTPLLRLSDWLAGFLPAQGNVGLAERMRGGCGALVGLLLTGWICAHVPGGGSSALLFIAPMGASAVGAFARR